MYLSEICDVKYEDKHNVVLVEWKKFCCMEDYRKPLECALDIIKDHEGCNYVADTKNGFENIPEDLNGVHSTLCQKQKNMVVKLFILLLIREIL